MGQVPCNIHTQKPILYSHGGRFHQTCYLEFPETQESSPQTCSKLLNTPNHKKQTTVCYSSRLWWQIPKCTARELVPRKWYPNRSNSAVLPITEWCSRAHESHTS